MYVVALDQNDITWLAFAAGIATGSGNAAAQTSLFGILSRIEEMPDGAGLAVADVPESRPAEPEDFGGTVDSNFIPPTPEPPSRPQTEFGPGPVQGGLR